MGFLLGQPACTRQRPKRAGPSGQKVGEGKFSFFFYLKAISTHFEIILNHFEFRSKYTHHNKSNAVA